MKPTIQQSQSNQKEKHGDINPNSAGLLNLAWGQGAQSMCSHQGFVKREEFYFRYCDFYFSYFFSLPNVMERVLLTISNKLNKVPLLLQNFGQHLLDHPKTQWKTKRIFLIPLNVKALDWKKWVFIKEVRLNSLVFKEWKSVDA